MKYNKLVRDKIPEIILQKGGTPLIHIAEGDEYWLKLKEKLKEEVEEFERDETTEELADILEVLGAIYKEKNITQKEVEEVRKKKYEERGGFEQKIILEES